MNEINADWSKKDLFYVEKLETTLKKEKQKQKKLYNELLRESNERNRYEIEQKIKKLDVKINLRRILYSDQKYLSIGRNKPTSTFFEPVIMNRILHDASKISKYQNELTSSSFNEFSSKIEKNKRDPPPPINGLLRYNFGDDTSCSRYLRNSKRFENREYIKLMENDKEDPSNLNNRFSYSNGFKLPSIKNVRLEDEVNTTSELVLNINNDTNENKQSTPEINTKENSTITNREVTHETASLPTNILKPRNQQVSSADLHKETIKLPSIGKKVI